MHVVNGPSQRNTAGWLKEVAHEQDQRRHSPGTGRVVVVTDPAPKGVLDRLISGFQNLFYTCCYSSEAKRLLEEVELAEAPVAPEHFSEPEPLFSPPASIVIDEDGELVFGVTNLDTASARADALFAPYIARRMQHLGSARYQHRLPSFFGTNSLITIVHGEINDGHLPDLLFT